MRKAISAYTLVELLIVLVIIALVLTFLPKLKPGALVAESEFSKFSALMTRSYKEALTSASNVVLVFHLKANQISATSQHTTFSETVSLSQDSLQVQVNSFETIADQLTYIIQPSSLFQDLVIKYRHHGKVTKYYFDILTHKLRVYPDSFEQKKLL